MECWLNALGHGENDLGTSVREVCRLNALGRGEDDLKMWVREEYSDRYDYCISCFCVFNVRTSTVRYGNMLQNCTLGDYFCCSCQNSICAAGTEELAWECANKYRALVERAVEWRKG